MIINITSACIIGISSFIYVSFKNKLHIIQSWKPYTFQKDFFRSGYITFTLTFRIN